MEGLTGFENPSTALRAVPLPENLGKQFGAAAYSLRPLSRSQPAYFPVPRRLSPICGLPSFQKRGAT
jgi:hypothetical protein